MPKLFGEGGLFKKFERKHYIIAGIVLVVLIVIVVVILVVALLMLTKSREKRSRPAGIPIDPDELLHCQKQCQFSLVESIPDGMEYRSSPTPYPSTFTVWSDLITNAKTTVEIVSYYWTLTDGTKGGYSTGNQGQQIYDHLLRAGTTWKLDVKIAQNLPSKEEPNTDTEELAKKHAATVRSLNFPKLHGSGILHTKLWLLDRTHTYIGSANSDWRSLTEVKELGIKISECPCIADDIGKIFDVYWAMGKEGAVLPKKWPDSLATSYNKNSPMNMSKSGLIYISSSPPDFCPEGRTKDADAIVDVIAKAKKFIYVAVMDYFPMFIYSSKPKYWGVIDQALRAAAIDNTVEVRLLVSWWVHSQEDMKKFARSLVDMSNNKTIKISVKLFTVPATAEQAKIPYARVNHNKYMVTDNTAYIGTSNWAGDYFTTTGGVGVVIEGPTDIRNQLESVFQRDWDSEFAYDLPPSNAENPAPHS